MCVVRNTEELCMRRKVPKGIGKQQTLFLPRERKEEKFLREREREMENMASALGVLPVFFTFWSLW